jgi:hypothetical protein
VRQNENENKVKIDPLFAAAQGVALLNFESRLVPCKSECEGYGTLESVRGVTCNFTAGSPKDLISEEGSDWQVLARDRNI